MESIRQKQVGELIKRNFSFILQQEGGYIYGKEPLVTIMNVKMTPDLSEAKIYISVYNTEHKQEVLLCLEEANTKLRQSLGQRIKKQVRIIPTIQIFLDETIDEMYRVDELFLKIEKEKQKNNIA
ncbi:MAG: 30S ribosome-binding factor RbfA [Saprospiraceae bacterium]|nr:30S ribosome-binding factor RbfA [Saprospiraceae bacterium]MBL0190301.1 30S ribosome-binding factor RbfA [Saprospiraceae bacterium]MBL0294176.1 30S ribosome-binding factor RbfA [Saprospiraceae bacterium]